jgi:hypothetical protein
MRRPFPLLLLLTLSAILVGCREVGLSNPEASVQAVIMPQTAAPPHAHFAAAVATRMQMLGNIQAPKGTTYQLTAPAAGEPVPIPGGLIPGLAHVWAPGPPEVGFQGVDVEPNTITNFNGFTAIAFLLGPATGSDGETYDQSHDMRVMRGTFVDSEGRHQHGTFVFI